MKKRVFFILIIIFLVVGIYFVNYLITGNVVASNDKFCGKSVYAYCTSSETCMPGGCGYYLCGGWREYRVPSEKCLVKDCYNSTKYNMECICYKHLCQWRSKT